MSVINGKTQLTGTFSTHRRQSADQATNGAHIDLSPLQTASVPTSHRPRRTRWLNVRNAKPRPGSADVSPSLPADALAGITHTARQGLHADSPVCRQTQQSRKRGRTESDFQTEARLHGAQPPHAAGLFARLQVNCAPGRAKRRTELRRQALRRW